MPYTVMETNTEEKLILIAKRVKEDPKDKFTSLVHLLNADYLKNCYKQLKRGKAAGVDGRRAESYTNEEINRVLEETARSIQAKRYQPKPVKRVYINKEGGKLRPLGIPTVVDKVVQLGVTRILEQIYESEFLPVSYGYRKCKDPHQCLKEINHMIMGQKLNWIIDADIKGFFDNINHEWMIRCLNEKIVDPNLKELISRFLKAGIMEEGRLSKAEEGTPQGGIISPLLANIYLHYVLDLWFERRVKTHIKGFAQIVRFADDFVIGVQHKWEADRILKDLAERLKRFGLELSLEKTRIIEFGRFACGNVKRTGSKRPKTFDFLGFTHYCSKTKDGRYMIRLKTARKRVNRAFIEMNLWLKSVRNLTKLENIWKTLVLKMQGHYNYYGVSGNFESIKKFYGKTLKLIFKWLNRRSQKKSWNMESFGKYLKTYPLPEPKLTYAIYNTW